MNIIVFLFIVFFGLVLYSLLHEPPSDLVFTSSSEAEVGMMQKYLAANGIRTYIKSRDLSRLVLSGALSDPSLHVIDANDCRRAIELIRGHESSDGKLHEGHG